MSLSGNCRRKGGIAAGLSMLAVVAALCLASCAEKTVYVEAGRDPGSSGGPIITPDIDIQDFQDAAARLLNDMSTHFDFSKAKGQRSTIAVADVRNHTTTQIQTRLLTTKFETELSKRKDAEIYAGPDTVAQQWIQKARELAGSPMTKEATLPRPGRAPAPDYVLIADILSKSQKYRGVRQNTYVFQARLFDVERNTFPWVDEVIIIKQEM